jgi:S-adenosylmethionine/arginine decarboxylase-like enzyme
MKQPSAAADLMRPDARYGRAAKAVRSRGDGDLKPYELDDKGGIRPARPDGDHWGYHLILDCSECNEMVDDPPMVTAYLREMVQALNMIAVGEPVVHQFTGEGDEGRGTSGVQIITTSSITFHSDDDEWAAYIDIFSCKEFKPQIAIDLTKRHFAPKEMGCLWLYRDAGPWPKK